MQPGVIDLLEVIQREMDRGGNASVRRGGGRTKTIRRRSDMVRKASSSASCLTKGNDSAEAVYSYSEMVVVLGEPE